ncbi:putative acetyltransferase [Brachybacterium sp. DNPG3]
MTTAPDSPRPLPRPGWAPFIEPGRRVVLRYRIDPEASPHGESMTDALGTVRAVDEDTVTVMTRRGEARVVRGLVTAAKEVPPPPRRPPLRDPFADRRSDAPG